MMRAGAEGCEAQGQNRETEGRVARLYAINAEMTKSDDSKSR
jgi:hypothetical protein